MTRTVRAPTPPRVLLVTGEYPPATGGVGDYTALLATALRAAGVATSVVTSQPGAVPAALDGTADAVPVHRLTTGWGFDAWRVLDQLLARERPDLLHLQYQAGAFGGRGAIPLLPWRLGRRASAPPVVVTFHDLHTPYLFPKAGRLRPLALRLLARASAATIATNGADFAILQRWLPADRLELIPIGSSLPLACSRADERATGDVVLLAYFGLASASKGLDTLLDALARLEHETPGRYQLLLIGGDASPTDPAYFGDATTLTAALQARGLVDRVQVTGALPAREAAALLRAADLAVLPYRDGASWRRASLLAALAQGCPLVTTTPRPGYDAGGRLPALVDGEHVLLVPPGDPVALAAAIARGANDAALRARLATGARALARSFDWSTIAARHVALYQRLSVASTRPR